VPGRAVRFLFEPGNDPKGPVRSGTVRVVARSSYTRVDCADTGAPAASDRTLETALGLFQGRDRRHVAIVITSDGRRLPMPLNGSGLTDASLFGILRSLLLGLDGLVGLITGSRRENGGTRRDQRR
jgi:hypothetical protein